MYHPIDRHGDTMYVFDYSSIIKGYKDKIKKLEEENEHLKQQIEELQKEKDFILQGLM